MTNSQATSSERDAYAALDVGSNTIRLLVARPLDGDLETIAEESRFVRLGAGVDSAGNLNPDRKRDAIRAIRDLTRLAKSAGAREIRAVATSAVRDAGNGQEFVGEVRSETGVEVQILSGDEEARLTFLGTTLRLELSHGALVSDIGGGSSELISAGPSGIEWARSFRLGSGRLTDRFVRHDPPTDEERSSIHGYVLTCLGHLRSPEAELAVFTGGTATNIASLATRTREINTPITFDDIDHVERLSYAFSSTDLAQKYRVRPERAAVFPAGITIVRTIVEWSAARHILVTRHGIREGVILGLINERLKPNSPSTAAGAAT